jgi:hypothetical protein
MSLKTIQAKCFSNFSFQKKDLVEYNASGEITGIKDFFEPEGITYSFSKPLQAVKDGEIVYAHFDDTGESFCEVAATANVEGDFLFYVKSEKVPNILVSYGDGEYFYGKADTNNPTQSYNGPAYKELRINGTPITDTCANIADLTLNKFALIELRGLTIPKVTWRFGGYKDLPDLAWSGLIGQVVLTHFALTDIEIAELEARILQNYGQLGLLPADHPFKSGVASYDRTIVGRAPAVKITSWLKPKVSIVDWENGQEVKALTNVQADGSFMYDTDSQQEVRVAVKYELTQESIDINGNDSDYDYIKALDHAIDGTTPDDTDANKDAQIASLNTQNKELQAKVTELESRLTIAQDENTTLTANNTNLQTQLDTANNRIANANALVFILQDTLILSSKSDVVSGHFYTNIPTSDIAISYSEANKSTVYFGTDSEGRTTFSMHYVSGSTNHSTFTFTHIPTNTEIGTGTFNTSYASSVGTKIYFTKVDI